ncbi:MAG: general secretion pathway protein GspB [Gammaproteobacteria bacterium]|nr:general secretion pathway protein GspB [Gammaproteobacteria bacterium]MCW8910900.1 general secretion pathway protein GspB [Gammaproteobacteria bacterium]MCW9004590.1 general secretion pathway protein GspB [Gammaproteobacteria bacterium]MCW9056714.1 general secretion pathway protein GspB [Gammaproteobacteria bacterium]
MSYILEALKKSDQTRKQGNIPDLQTIHVPLSVEVQQSRWPYIIIVVLLMGLVFLLGWMRPWQAASVAEPVVNNPQIINDSIKASVVIEQQVVAEIQPDNNQKVDIQKPQLTEQIEMPEAEKLMVRADSGQQPVPHLQELPALLQQAIPDMSFAGHVYSSNPAQRSVIINGSAMGEGDLIIGDLRIDEITSNGVIFDYQAQRFRIDILQDWSFD